VRRSKPEDLDEALCRRQALDLLARREHSRYELERKLAARGFDAALIAPALDRLERDGLLVAARFTETFIRSRAAKGQGPKRIRAELAARGVDEHQAEQLLQAAGIDWAAAAASVRRKRFGAERPVGFADRARQAKFLQYRGFDSAAIKAALELKADSD
jgi:regulatory protein